MTAPVRCPHCGAAISAHTNIPDELLKQSLFALTQDATLNSAILRVLIRYFGNNVSAELIVNACYGSREPPLTVANTIRGAHLAAPPRGGATWARHRQRTLSLQLPA